MALNITVAMLKPIVLKIQIPMKLLAFESLEEEVEINTVVMIPDSMQNSPHNSSGGFSNQHISKHQLKAIHNHTNSS